MLKFNLFIQQEYKQVSSLLSARPSAEHPGDQVESDTESAHLGAYSKLGRQRMKSIILN